MQRAYPSVETATQSTAAAEKQIFYTIRDEDTNISRESQHLMRREMDRTTGDRIVLDTMPALLCLVVCRSLRNMLWVRGFFANLEFS
jgi:hypothetical protein